MGRKYEVHIEGKPLVIGERPDPRSVPDHWLVMEVHARHEVAEVVRQLAGHRQLRGLLIHGEDVDRLWDWFREGYVFVQAAGGAVTDERGRLLAIHRLGLWDLPKGKVEPDEPIAEAAVREVKEECGLVHVELTGPLCETWHTYERKGRHHLKRTDWFLMEGRSSDPLIAQTEEDITEVRWMDAGDIAALLRATYPSLLRVIDAWAADPRRRA
ncbi:MAG: NUDIX domain-containing protein [Flavobacteriales bacterium]